MSAKHNKKVKRTDPLTIIFNSKTISGTDCVKTHFVLSNLSISEKNDVYFSNSMKNMSQICLDFM